jgi:hypothetical protein
MLNFVGKFIDRTFVVIGALVLSQAPFFMQQYTQQLSGHVAELHIYMNTIQNAAALSGKTVPQYIQKFVENADVDFARQGDVMQGMVDRWSFLTDALESMQHTTVFSKPFVFITQFNWEIAKATWTSFDFGFAFNSESILYALAGMCLGYLVFWVLKTITTLTFKKAILLCKTPNQQPQP